MRAGLLTEPIEIYRKVEIISEYGDTSTDYQYFYSTKAWITNNGGGVSVQDERTVYDTSLVFNIRFYNKLEETIRIKYNGRFYKVINIEYDRKLNKISIRADRVND